MKHSSQTWQNQEWLPSEEKTAILVLAVSWVEACPPPLNIG